MFRALMSVGHAPQLALVDSIDAGGTRGGFSTELLARPSVQFRPLTQMRIDVAPLFGVTRAASRSNVFVVIGYEF